MLLRLFIWYLLCFAAMGVCAQGGKDSTYIGQFKRINNIQFNTWVTNVSMNVNPRIQGKNLEVKLEPNIKGQAGVSFGLKKITVFMGFQIPGTQASESKYGKTSYYDFSFGYFKNQFGGEIYFRYFDGMFRLKNDTVTLTIRPDVFVSNAGLNFFYTFDHAHFSLRSALAQQELQKQSAGSFVIMANVQQRFLRADSSVIPKPVDNNINFQGLNGLKQMQFITLNVRPGYAHNFVWKGGRWFFSPSVYLGLGTGWYSTQTARGYSEGQTLDMDLHSKIFAGYNHPLWFCSAYFVYDGSMNVFNNNLVSLNTRSFGINLGFRLNSYFRIKWL